MSLHDFLAAAESIRTAYESHGPNKVCADLFTPVETLDFQLSETIEIPELLDAIKTVKQLCYRCVHHTEGLCFVTGEYGLVPRADLVKEFDDAMDLIKRHLDSPT